MSAIPPYVAVILDQPAVGPEWTSWLTHELALRGVFLGTDGTLEDGDLILGFFRFLEPEETETSLQSANVEVGEPGRVAGQVLSAAPSGGFVPDSKRTCFAPSSHSWSGWAEALSFRRRMAPITSCSGREHSRWTTS